MINKTGKVFKPNIISEVLQTTFHVYSLNRRDFLSGMITSLLAATFLITAIFFPFTFSSSAHAQSRVDVHCHIFNARDVPLVGTLKHLLKDTPLLSNPTRSAIAALITQNALSDTPDYVDENEKLNELLTGTQTLQCPPWSGTGLIQAQEWLNLFKRYRFEIACKLIDENQDINLFTPAMIDFDHWLTDDETAETTIAEQVILNEKIARLFEGKIHPLVAFNPLKEAYYENDFQLYKPLEWVKEAVRERGFIGVKLYPPMGFYPIDNAVLADPNDQFYEYRGKIDKILIELYNWCIAEDVPIMVHCSDSNEAQRGFGERSHPRYWKRVLDKKTGYNELRLNLGHFGHDIKDAIHGPGWSIPTSWAWYVAETLMNDPASNYPNVYADVGFHSDFLPPMWLQPTGYATINRLILLGSIFLKQEYFDGLDDLYNDSLLGDKVKERLMYGSDSHVFMMHPWHEYYKEIFEEIFDTQWPWNLKLKDHFLGLNALRFFGLDKPAGTTQTQNQQRLLRFYQQHNITEKPDWWVGDWWMTTNPALAPSSPGSLSATYVSSPAGIQLQWSASTGAVEYKIYRDAGRHAIATVSTTSYTDSNVSPAITYTYNIFAVDSAGNVSKRSQPVSAP